MNSMRPYLLRAVYEWIVDNNLTPQLVIDALAPGVEIPRQHVQEGKITFNISPTAVRDLNLGNDWVSFSARFSGAAMSVLVPVSAVLVVYARENEQGMVFQPEENPPETPPPAGQKSPEAVPPKRGKPTLTRVK